MPGPVSDSYDPVWSTGSNASEVREGIRKVERKLCEILQSPPQYILDVIRSKDGPTILDARFSERELRIIRYGLRVALEEEDI